MAHLERKENNLIEKLKITGDVRRARPKTTDLHRCLSSETPKARFGRIIFCSSNFEYFFTNISFLAWNNKGCNKVNDEIIGFSPNGKLVQAQHHKNCGYSVSTTPLTLYGSSMKGTTSNKIFKHDTS